MSEAVDMPKGWTETEVAGVRCAVCGGDQQAGAAEQAAIVLPNHGGDVPWGALQQSSGSQNAMIVVPLVKQCWWSDRTCGDFPQDANASDWLRNKLRPWLIDQLATGSSAPALIGFEAGGQGALRLAYRFPDEFPVVAAVRPAIDCHLCLRPVSPLKAHRASLRKLYNSEEAARQDSATLHIHPLNWPRHQWFCCPSNSVWWEGADRLRMKLFSLGVMHQCELESEDLPTGDGTEYDSQATSAAWGFIASGLAAEQRRA